MPANAEDAVRTAAALLFDVFGSELCAKVLPLLATELAERLLPPFIAEIRGLRAQFGKIPERWGTRLEATEFYGMCLDSVDRRIRDGSLRSKKLGRSVRVLLETPATDDEIAELARAARGAR